jgi:hypothetical protein
MTVTSIQTGSQACTIGTEHTLGTAIATAGAYQLKLDLTPMVNGDELEVRAYTKCKPGSTARLEDIFYFRHAQSMLNRRCIPWPTDVEIYFTIKQVAGTGRTFDWNIVGL